MAISLNGIKHKLSILADAAKYDASCSSSGGSRKRAEGGLGNSEGMGICHSYTPDGRCVSLLKILLTNFCIYDCKFCVNRSSNDIKRARFKPEEVVALTMELYRRNYIEGLFLSSGVIKNSDYTMEQLIKVARDLREIHKFNGYIHLKIVVGASRELIQKAGLWADRVSANIEMSTQEELDILAPGKTISQAQSAMSDVAEKTLEYKEDKKKFKSTPKFAPAGQSTQMVVGAIENSDRSILTRAENLYDAFSLRRVFYSAYTPIENSYGDLLATETPLLREHRLYQADWLLRFYGFKADELIKNTQNLSLEVDPKVAWALDNRSFFPLDINKASREQLLRVPGLGVRSVDKIIQLRRIQRLWMQDLIRMKIPLNKAKYFITVHDTNPDLSFLDTQNFDKLFKPKEEQLVLI